MRILGLLWGRSNGKHEDVVLGTARQFRSEPVDDYLDSAKLAAGLWQSRMEQGNAHSTPSAPKGRDLVGPLRSGDTTGSGSGTTPAQNERGTLGRGRRRALGLLVALALLVATTAVAGPELWRRLAHAHPTTGVTTSCLANSFGGGRPEAAQSAWVQQDVQGMAVQSDGTVFATSEYDEGGREVGVYRDGRVVGKLAGTHGLGRTGGSTVTVEGGEVLVAVAQTSEFASAAPAGGRAYGVRSFDAVTYQPIPVSGGSGSDRSTRVLSTTGPVTGLAATSALLYVAIAKEGVIRVLDRGDARPVREIHVSDAQDIVVDGGSGLWVTTKDSFLHLSAEGIELTRVNISRPTALVLSNKNVLLVATDGPAQQVLFYDVGRTQPRLVGALGEKGGMRAFDGRAGALRFDGITGVGVDGAGALYIAAGLGGTGTDLRKAVRDPSGWRQEWQLLALAFVDGADTDPLNPRIAYTARDRYRLDLSRPAGQQWTWEAHTIDRMRFPGDPRLKDDHRHVSPDVVRVRGRLLLFVTGMYQEHPGFYRLDGETAITSTTFPTGGWGWQVDQRGDVWNADGAVLRRFPFVGFSSAGDPRYGPLEQTVAPVGFTSLQRINYDAALDVMFLSGWTTEHPRPAGNDLEKLIGREVWRVDRWSTGNRVPAWRLVAPCSRIGSNIRTLFGQIGLSIAGDRVFLVEMATSRVREYDAGSARLLRTWVPGSEVGGYVGVVDVPDGLRAVTLAKGRFVIFVEEDHAAKVLLYDVRG